jgi:LmbE family N-acetylglucosaminyl deacetylase
MKKILVISPHLDDAALSCCDHILDWKKQEHEVTVLTIFTKFSDKYISDSAKKNILACGVTNAKQLETLRKIEDREAMKLLQVRYKYLEFTDGWFRSYLRKPIYPGKALFEGIISEDDKTLVEKINKRLKGYSDFEKVIIPFGIGNHVDHVMIRQIAEKIFKTEKLFYYLDQPYTSKIPNWNMELICKYIQNKILGRLSTMPTSNKKIETLKKYKSQFKLLFLQSPIKYEEVIFYTIK